MIIGIEHTAIYANDSKMLSDWYAEMFDGRIVFDNGEGAYFVAFSDKTMIEFCKNSDAKNQIKDLTEPGIRHIALTVDDISVAADKVKAANVEILKDVTVTEDGISIMFFRDPEGNVLHFIQRPQPLV